MNFPVIMAFDKIRDKINKSNNEFENSFQKGVFR